MAEIIQNPELRYTSDTQTPIAEMMVQFPGLRPEEPPATLKVVGWGNLAQEIQEQFRQGDRVVIEGRLTMNTLDRPEGFKEKRAELTAQRVYRLGADTPIVAPAITSTQAPQISAPPPVTPPPRAVSSAPAPAAAKPAAKPAVVAAPPVAEPDFDDIPF